MIRWAFYIIWSAVLTACASSPPVQVRRAVPAPGKLKIEVFTSPPGGVVDWNGNVLGAAPVSLIFRPDTTLSGRPVWPENGASFQTLRARWPDGSHAAEVFTNRETPPQVVGIVSPNAPYYHRNQPRITQ
jgi:hypothetical protein